MLPETPGAAVPGEVRAIAVVRALFLGDLLLSVPAWRALRRRFPRAEITLIGLPWADAFVARMGHLVDRLLLFPGYPGIQEVPYDPERTAAFLAEQRAYGYDLALQMHGDGTATNGFTAALGARGSLGYARPGDQRLAVCLPYEDGQHEARRWLRLAGAVGAPVGDARPEFRATAADRAEAAALLGSAPGGPRVAMHLGAKDPQRRWPPRQFAALGQALRKRCGARLMLTGTAGERGLAAEAAAAMAEPPLDLTGRTGLGAFAALLARSDLLVTNDTGASHLAAAVGTPSVVLFGPTRPAVFAPLDGARHHAVDALAFAPPGASPAAALAHMPVRPVLDACLAQLAAHAGPPAELARAVGGGEDLCAD